MTALTYIFDPLCGWCYGAAPAVRALVAAGHAVTLMPSGLFIAPGRTIDAEFAAYIWSADQRVAQYTGQEFSETYRTEVLGRPNAPFDSTAATRAIVAVHRAEPARKLEALEAIQRARWVEGRDICDPMTLIGVLDAVGLPTPLPDASLAAETRDRVGAARSLMARLGIEGVPALLIGAARVLPIGLLFGPREALLAAVA